MNFYDEYIGGYDGKWAVDNGWAVPPLAKLATVQSMDLSGITISGGDFAQKALQSELNKEATKQRICLIASEELDGPTVLFTVGVDAAKACAHYLTHNYNINAVYVHGKQPAEERQEALQAFRSGQAKILCNCQVVAVGFDHPPTQTLIMGRPTKSRPFALQCWGRALRPLAGVVDFPDSTAESRKAAIAKSDKPYAKIVDCTPATQDHTLVTSVDMFVSLEPGAKKAVTEAAMLSAKPLTPEEIAELAEKHAAKVAAAKAIEEMRRNTTGRATGSVQSFDVDITGGVKRSVGTYRNPLRGKYGNMRMCDLPDFYLSWMENNHGLSAWIRGIAKRERHRRSSGVSDGRRPARAL